MSASSGSAVSGPPRNASSRSAGAADAPGRNRRSHMKVYQPGSPGEPRPAHLSRPLPDGCGDDGRQRVVRDVAGRLDELAADRPPRPLGVRLDAEAVARDRRPDVVRAAVAGPGGARARTAPSATSSITAPYRSSRASRGVGGLAEPVSLPGGLGGIPAEDVGRALEERGVGGGPLEERRSGPDRRAPWMAWPLSWSSSTRLPRPPSA